MNQNESSRFQDLTSRKYSSDGGFTIQGAMLNVAVGAFVAVLVGLVAGVIGQFFYMVLIFPLFIGGVIAKTQVAIIGRTKIRNPLVCGFAGLVCGLLAVATMHFVDYIVFQQEMSVADSEYEAAKSTLLEMEDDQYKTEYRAALNQYRNDPSVIASRAVNSFPAYIDWAAKQGVELSSGAGTRSASNLGYTGTYLYWFCESLLIAGMCVVMTRSRAAQPFCIHCDNWMPETELVTLHCDAKAASNAVQSGNLERLSTLFAANKETCLSIFCCANCTRGDAVVQTSAVKYNQGERGKTVAARYVFDAAIAKRLEDLFFDTKQSDDAILHRLESEVNALAKTAGSQTDSILDRSSLCRTTRP